VAKLVSTHNKPSSLPGDIHVSNKQDGHAGVVLSALQAEVLFEVVQPGIDQSIAIEVVKEIHEP
jgi:hypothetical protein